MGAINTVDVLHGKLHGFNTDGPGFSAAIREEFGVRLSELRVLILGGAGGAGRAIACQCVMEGCPRIVIANRRNETGTALAREVYDQLGTGIIAIPLTTDALFTALPSVDLVVNATPLGMRNGDGSPLPDHLLTSQHLVYDTVYSAFRTALLRQAISAGSRCAGGLSMLLHQGALAYEIWFHETAPVEAMRRALAKASDLDVA
jgi:shikimate dehydrogenase